MAVTVFSPAKINLYLAVTGRRGDGFHDLVSVVAPLDFGDEVEALLRQGFHRRQGYGGQVEGHGRAGSQFSLECDQPGVPVDGSNLVLKAAAAFAAATGFKEQVAFRLTKRIPMGAGLGGGSSNAVAALRALNQLTGGLLPEPQLAGVAAGLGSDCALFLQQAPVIMRGRGEQIERLSDAAAARLGGRRILVFKPGFAIATPWAYRRMVERGSDYLPAAAAEDRLAAWLKGGAPADDLLFNNMEAAAFEKFPALPVLLGKMRQTFGITGQMSGSGSACFALLGDDFVSAPLVECVRLCWGPSAWVQEVRIA